MAEQSNILPTRLARLGPADRRHRAATRLAATTSGHAPQPLRNVFAAAANNNTAAWLLPLVAPEVDAASKPTEAPQAQTERADADMAVTEMPETAVATTLDGGAAPEKPQNDVSVGALANAESEGSVTDEHVLQLKAEACRQLTDYRRLARNLGPLARPAQPDGAESSMEQLDGKCFARAFRERTRLSEYQLASRISYRINELQTLPARLPEDLQLRALIELRALRLENFQAALRLKLWRSRHPCSSLETAYRAPAYARIKPLSIRDPKHTEMIERQQREQQEQMERRKHLAFVEQVVAHESEFRDFHAKMRRQLGKICRAVLMYHANKGKREQVEKERMEKERLKLLMAQDTEGYKRLLDAEKDSRKRFLLDKIDERIAIMDSLIESHQQAETETELKQAKKDKKQPAAAEDEGAAAAAEDGLALAGPADEDTQAMQLQAAKAAAKGGFEAHVTKEAVTEQPSILVGGSLKPYQLSGLEWLISLYNNKLNGILADEMGLGKTIQTIALLTYLVEKKNNRGPFIVIVPLATLSNWTLECEKWAPSLNVITYRGNKIERRRFHSQIREIKFNVLLTTYEMILKDKAVLSKINWRYLIIDEGHRMKNSNNKLSQTLMQFFNSSRRLLLTGTPLQNNLPELWALLNFLLPDVFNSSSTFDSWFNAPFAGTGEKLELDEEETQLIILQLHRILRPFLLRRLKKEVETQLPDKVEYILKCEMSQLQRKLYQHMQKEGIILTSEPSEANKRKMAKGAAAGAARALENRVMQLRKICCHPFLFPEVERDYMTHMAAVYGASQAQREINGTELWRTAGKFELLDRLLPKLHAAGHRSLLFSQFTTVLNILEDYFRYRNITYLRMDGSTKAEERGDLLKLYNAPDSPYEIFILSTRAGGLGLNLQTADTVIIFDSDWNPHQDLQAQDRAHRIGQTREVRVLRLVTTNSVEERMLERARDKLNVDKKVIQAGKFNQKSSEEDARDFLASILNEEQDDEEDDSAMDPEQINHMLARSEEELTMFQNMDKDLLDPRNQSWRDDRRQERLITKDELPEYLKNSEQLLRDIYEAANVVEDLGRGVRERSNISYADNLTDQEFMRAVESGQLDEALEQKRAGKRLRRGTPASAAGTPSALPKGASGRVMRSIMKEFVNYADRHGNIVATNFMDLPDPSDQPDFYEKISKPLDINTVMARLGKRQYRSVDHLASNVSLVLDNAQSYYGEGSDMYDAAETLREVFNELRQRAEADAIAQADEPKGKRSKLMNDDDGDGDEAMRDDLVGDDGAQAAAGLPEEADEDEEDEA